MQLALLDIILTKEAKRQAEKLMGRYKMYEAIVKSREIETVEPKLTVNYAPSESQRGNQFYSETEKIALTNVEIDDYTKTLMKLDFIYESLKPKQKEIWQYRYILGWYDTEVYTALDIPDRTYYRLKREMIAVVAEAFNLN